MLRPAATHRLRILATAELQGMVSTALTTAALAPKMCFATQCSEVTKERGEIVVIADTMTYIKLNDGVICKMFENYLVFY